MVWTDESTWPPNPTIKMVPPDQIPNLTEDQLDQLGFFDNVKVSIGAGTGGGGASMENRAKFASQVSEAIPDKKVISFNVTTVANVNLFRPKEEVYLRFLNGGGGGK